jgi:tetratricopeptide (TPR) repeat protein
MFSIFYQNKITFPIVIIIALFFFNCASKKIQAETNASPQTPPLSEKEQPDTQTEDRSALDSFNQKTEVAGLQSKLTKCFQSANALEKQEDYRTASEKHTECCFLGSLDSCNHSGRLKLEIFNHMKAAYHFFNMACEGKNGLGCFNLSELEKAQGHEASADTFQLLACSYGLNKACIKNIEEGKTHLQNHQFKKAIQSFNSALIQQPKNAPILALRGYAYNQTGQYLKAYQDFSEAITVNPKEPNYYAQRALYHISRQNYQLAKEDYTLAINIQEKSEFFRMRGLMQLYLGNFQRSVQDSSDAIGIESNDLKAYVNRGSAWMYLKNYQKAIENFNYVILLKSDHIFALSNRGMAYQLMGDLKKAKADFQKSVTIDNYNTLMILNYLETKILTNDLNDINTYIDRAYLTARNNEEKLLTIFTDLLVKFLRKKSTSKTEKEFNHHLRNKILLQTSFDALETYLKKITPSTEPLDQILSYIQQLKNPAINLFYR